jgi:hypothetical protein
MSGWMVDVVPTDDLLARVPQVVPGIGAGGDPVGGHQGAVQAQEGHSGVVRSREDLIQVRCVGGDHVQPFVQVLVGGRDAQAGIAGQQSQVQSVTQPAQDEHTWVCTVPARWSGRVPGRRR